MSLLTCEWERSNFHSFSDILVNLVRYRQYDFRAFSRRFFLCICWISTEFDEIIDNSRYRSHQRTCLHESDDYRSRQLLKFRLIGQSSICPEKILKFQHFVNLLKYSIWMNLGGGVDMWYVLVTGLTCSILLESLIDPHIQLSELWSKNRSFEVTHSNFFVPIGFTGKVDFF